MKTVNYTAEQITALVAAFEAGKTIEAIAAELGKTTRSVIAKLSQLNLYKAKTATAKAKVTTKADLVAKIAEKFGVDAVKLGTLEKANKEALEILAA